MLTFILRRLLIMVPMVLCLSFLVFAGIELTPGDAVSFMFPPDALAEIAPADLDKLRASLGLNQPFMVRYVIWLKNVLHGDFGYSLQSGVAISTLVLRRLPVTLELSVCALIISTILGSLLGLISALKKNSFLDHILTFLGMLGVSIPQFFFGLVAILIFSLQLGWLPNGGRLTPNMEGMQLLDRLRHLILPASVLGLTLTAGVMRYSRASMLNTLHKEYIKTARSKGLPAWRINLVHCFRVALTPVIVLVGFRLPMLLGGTVAIEKVFQWPGIGTVFIAAVQSQNLPLVMMIALFTVIAVFLASFLVDLFTALLDPRVRLS